MATDRTDGRRSRVPGDPDPDYAKRRRTDHHRSGDASMGENRRSSGGGRRSGSRKERRSRVPALGVLIGVLVLIVVIGLQAGGSGGVGSAGRPVPFSLLPLEGSSITSSTYPESDRSTTGTTSTSTPTGAASTSTTTTTTVAAADRAPDAVSQTDIGETRPALSDAAAASGPAASGPAFSGPTFPVIAQATKADVSR